MLPGAQDYALASQQNLGSLPSYPLALLDQQMRLLQVVLAWRLSLAIEARLPEARLLVAKLPAAKLPEARLLVANLLVTKQLVARLLEIRQVPSLATIELLPKVLLLVEVATFSEHLPQGLAISL